MGNRTLFLQQRMILFKVLFFGGLVAGEVCEENTVRTYVKLTKDQQEDGELWGERERDLLKNTISYSVSKYFDNNNINNMPDLAVNWDNETPRISFCLRLEDATPETPSTPIQRSSDYLRLSIYENKDVIYGAFPHFDESILVFEGVPKTYQLSDDSGLDQWYIPFFVVLGLVILGVCVGLYFSLRSPAEEDEKSQLSDAVAMSDVQPQIEEPVDEKAAEAAAESAGVQNDAFEEAKTDEVEMSADF